MKIITLFLLLVVVTLSLAPCCILENSSDKLNTTVSKKDPCNTNNNDCCAECSPFYVCGTCVGFTLNYYSGIKFNSQLIPVNHSMAYFPNKPFSLSNTIWQPPKLS